jgi:hypothetical protein
VAGSLCCTTSRLWRRCATICQVRSRVPRNQANVYAQQQQQHASGQHIEPALLREGTALCSWIRLAHIVL